MFSSLEIFKASILIVDDQKEDISLLDKMLRQAGYVFIASTMNPMEVCELHRQNRYHLILLDLQMPGMNGFEVMEGLKNIETSGYLPVLAITAQPELKLRALKAGAKDFVGKPFEFGEILARVHNMLEIRLLHLNATTLNLARLQNSQRIASLGDWEYDFTSHRMVWSEELYRILGLSQANSPADTETFYQRIHADDLAFVQHEKAVAVDGSGRADFEYRIVRPGGEVRYVHHISELIFDTQRRPTREVGTLQDITERRLSQGALRQSEERFKFVARAVSDAVWDWDLSTDTMWWNDGFLTTFGFAAGEIAPSLESWVDRIHPEDRSCVVDSIHQAIISSTESWGADYRVQRKDGSYAVIQNRGYILRDTAGKGVRVVGGMRDLTEQKKMEAQYLRAQRMESIGTLAGGIAHDLNNVLAPIMMSIELLKLDPANDPRRTETLNIVHASCSRGADLVRQVLSFARGLEGQKMAVRLRHLINDLEGMISETFPRNIRIETRVSEDLWVITGDPTQLHQVLLNLAVNARDAMPQGGVLTISASNTNIDTQPSGMSHTAKTRPHVLLQVADTGIGIPPVVRERIFEPFFTTKEFGQGTGLGLATVQTVVKNHDGFLKLESEVGQGTTFKIYMPADPDHATTDTGRPFQPDQPRGRNELVLVVDDEFSIRDITRQTLEAFGYRVILASNGVEAVALYSEHAQQISVVLTDMMMPLMDGAELIQRLIRVKPSVRIIAVSGLDRVDEVGEGRAQVMYFLSKPYTAQTLLELVREVIDLPASPFAG